jgi:hypothetical protein
MLTQRGSFFATLGLRIKPFQGFMRFEIGNFRFERETRNGTAHRGY